MKKAGNKSIKRILAVIGLVFIGVCLAGLILNVILGGSEKLTLAFLFMVMVVPAVLWIFISFTKTVYKKDDQG